jgi:hypothetical protein
MLQHVSAKLTPRDASPQQATSDALRGWLTSYIDRRAGKARRESGASRVRVLFDMLDVLPHRRGTTATVPHDAAATDALSGAVLATAARRACVRCGASIDADVRDAAHVAAHFCCPLCFARWL